MSTPAQASGSLPRTHPLRLHLPTAPEALATLLSLIVAALFLNTFVLQPYLIPSESMERTLLVGDFVLVNKQIYAPAGSLTRWLMPYREVARGDIVVFHHPHHPYVVKRVVGVPGDHIHLRNGIVVLNGVAQDQPHVEKTYGKPCYLGKQYDPKNPCEPGNYNEFLDEFPFVPPSRGLGATEAWALDFPNHIENGDLVVPPGMYFMMGDNRHDSNDSRFWGFVSRRQIVARPLVIYFSLSRPSGADVDQAPLQAALQAPLQASNGRLGHDRPFSAKLQSFARWKRIFHVVR